MKRRRKPIDVERIAMWAAAGVLIYRIGGKDFFIAWLMPGVPPPGPFG